MRKGKNSLYVKLLSETQKSSLINFEIQDSVFLIKQISYTVGSQLQIFYALKMQLALQDQKLSFKFDNLSLLFSF